MSHDHPPRTTLLLVAVGLCALAVSGCSNHKVVPADSGNKDRIQESDFVNLNGAPPRAQPPRNPSATFEASQSVAAEPLTLSTPARAAATAPARVSPARTDSSGFELLDAKVGDINGHPIYANEFFAPIRDRLMAESASLPPAQWQRSSARTIATRLDGIIADELLRAEALASLSQQQRLGLRSFLQGFRSDLLSENLGSSQLANRRVLEEQGITLDEALRKQEVDTLIRLTLFREINRRVNVSWRDIKQRYERDMDKYDPPPTAVFRRIRVFTEDSENIAKVTEHLNTGTSFESVASSKLNTFAPDKGGLEKFEIEESFAQTEFYGLDILNEKAWSLSPGEVAGPFESGVSTYWLTLEGIEQESISLYDAQLAIQREITLERRQEQQQEYLGRLIERAHFSSRDEILMQLIDIAQHRYGSPEQ